MGQLEKYGLYVLCLVIFLILGVTIWGGGDLQPQDRRPPAGAGAELNANGPGGSGNKSAKPAATGTMGALLDPTRSAKEPKNDPKPVPAPVAGNGEPTKQAGGKPADQPVDPVVTPPQPIAETVRPTHKVAAGDTFESIAKKLGSAALRTELQRLNPRIEPTRMRQGVELQLPTKAEVEQFLARGAAPRKVPVSGPDAAAKDATANKGAPKVAGASATTYTVAKGDTFEGIAVRQLGSKKRLDELLELNPNVRPTGLKVGQTIHLPKK